MRDATLFITGVFIQAAQLWIRRRVGTVYLLQCRQDRLAANGNAKWWRSRSPRISRRGTRREQDAKPGSGVLFEAIDLRLCRIAIREMESRPLRLALRFISRAKGARAAKCHRSRPAERGSLAIETSIAAIAKELRRWYAKGSGAYSLGTIPLWKSRQTPREMLPTPPAMLPPSDARARSAPASLQRPRKSSPWRGFYRGTAPVDPSSGPPLHYRLRRRATVRR